MKKQILSVLIALLLTASCSNTANKAIEQGKLAIANAEYENALNSLELAKNEGAKSQELDTMISILDNYINAKQAFESGVFDKAADAISKIPEEYSEYTIKDDIDALKTSIKEKAAASGNIDAQIAQVKQLVSVGDYENASKGITELYSKNLSDEQKSQVDELNSTILSAQNKINEASTQAAQNAAAKAAQDAAKAAAANTTVVATYYVVNCNEYITLRKSPSTSAGAITTIPLGSAVGYIENAGNGFYKIKYNGSVGYSLASYLSPDNYESAPRTATVINAQNFITLRATPSTSANELTKIPAGATVTYLGTAENGFYKISYAGMVGYGLQSYLRVN